jgi:indole-3-glycerol phosphate synthase
MNILETILEHKREEVKARKRSVPLSEFREKPFFALQRLSLAHALRRKDIAIIAEVKKASPSRGVLREKFDALAIAREYVHNNASAISVLTDEKFFQGDVQFIERMRSFVPIPILRKDFIVDAYQLYEAKACGADAVLLIASALDASLLHDLYAEAKEIDLECLVEVHSHKEIEALNFEEIEIVGINNRNLMTFETKLETSIELKRHIPNHIVCVSESGINSYDDIERLLEHDIHAFLIGETFMKAASPGNALAALLDPKKNLSRHESQNLWHNES